MLGATEDPDTEDPDTEEFSEEVHTKKGIGIFRRTAN